MENLRNVKKMNNRISKVQQIHKPQDYCFDQDQLYDKKTGKTVADVDSSTFSEILKEARNHEHRGNQKETY